MPKTPESMEQISADYQAIWSKYVDSNAHSNAWKSNPAATRMASGLAQDLDIVLTSRKASDLQHAADLLEQLKTVIIDTIGEETGREIYTLLNPTEEEE